jgi:hypothetical protein
MARDSLTHVTLTPSPANGGALLRASIAIAIRSRCFRAVCSSLHLTCIRCGPIESTRMDCSRSPVDGRKVLVSSETPLQLSCRRHGVFVVKSQESRPSWPDLTLHHSAQKEQNLGAVPRAISLRRRTQQSSGTLLSTQIPNGRIRLHFKESLASDATKASFFCATLRLCHGPKRVVQAVA